MLTDAFYIKGGFFQLYHQRAWDWIKWKRRCIGGVFGFGITDGSSRFEFAYTDYEDISITSGVARTGVSPNNKIDADLDTISLKYSYAF